MYVLVLINETYIPSSVFGGLTSHLGGDDTFCTATIHNVTFGIELPGWKFIITFT